jgi:hypothetical protein
VTEDYYIVEEIAYYIKKRIKDKKYIKIKTK